MHNSATILLNLFIRLSLCFPVQMIKLYNHCEAVSVKFDFQSFTHIVYIG